MKKPSRTAHVWAVVSIIFFFGASGLYAQSYNGRASAVNVTVRAIGQPVLTTGVADTGPLPHSGGISTLASSTVSIGAVGLSIGSSTVSASGNGDDTNASASVNNLTIGLLGNSISVDSLATQAHSSCPTNSTSGNSTFGTVIINGEEIEIAGVPNQEIPIFGKEGLLGTLRLNEQIPDARSMTVSAMNLQLTDPASLAEISIVVATSRTGINCAVAPSSDLFGGYGTGLWFQETGVLGSDLATIVSDTGALPSDGGELETSTLGVNLASGLITTGALASETSGGVEAGTPESTQSTSQVDGLNVSVLGIIDVGAGAVETNTECTCSLGVPTCTGDSDLASLSFTLPILGTTNVNLTGEPQIVTLPLGLGTIAVNEQIDDTYLTGGSKTINGLRLNINALGLTGNEIIAARSHSEIVCSLGPSSATVLVAGRVLDHQARGLRGAVVTIIDDMGNSRTVSTNGFGYYFFEDISSGRMYTISAVHRRYSYTTMAINVSDSVTDVDFSPISSRGLKGR